MSLKRQNIAIKTSPAKIILPWKIFTAHIVPKVKKNCTIHLALGVILAACSAENSSVADEILSSDVKQHNIQTFAKTIGIDVKALPDQIKVGENFIERVENRVPRENYRYEYSGTKDNSTFCRTFYKVFEQDMRSFVRVVRTSGQQSKYSFDGQFLSYIEPADVKDILSNLAYDFIPWKDIPQTEVGRLAYSLHFPEFSYTPDGQKQPGPLRKQEFHEFLKLIPTDYKPYQLFQTYTVPNSDYILFRTEGTDLFDPKIIELNKVSGRSPVAFRSYRHHFYNTHVLFNMHRDYDAGYTALLDFVSEDGLYFIGLGESNFRENSLGKIYAMHLDPALPPGPSTKPNCLIEIYLKP